jgi:hypothetical protein
MAGYCAAYADVRRPKPVLVWEYVNPYFEVRQSLVVNAVQRAYRYSADEIAKARTAT